VENSLNIVYSFSNNQFNDNDFNSNYESTDFIKIKRYQKRYSENDSTQERLKRNINSIKRRFFLHSLLKNKDNQTSRIIYNTKILQKKNASENVILNKRKLDNFIVDNTLYYNQYFGSQLNEVEKYIYDILVSQLKGVTLLSFFVNIDIENDFSIQSKDIVNIMERVFGALSMDHPDIWWITKYRIHYKVKNSKLQSNINDTTTNNNKNSNKTYKKDRKGYNEIISQENFEINEKKNENIQVINGNPKFNSYGRMIYINETQEEVGRRIKLRRDKYNKREPSDNISDGSRLLSKIQIQLCLSPNQNICNIYTVNDINRMNKVIEKKIQHILNNAKDYFISKNKDKKKELSYNDNIQIYEYDFIKYLHDILIKNVQYGFSENGFNEYTIYGALVEHRCVCEGFSEAFMILAQRAKIYTILATSNTHQWNMVFLEGKWYALDITWDIPNYNTIQNDYQHRQIISAYDNNDNNDFLYDNNSLFDNINTTFFLVGSKTVINEKPDY